MDLLFQLRYTELSEFFKPGNVNKLIGSITIVSSVNVVVLFLKIRWFTGMVMELVVGVESMVEVVVFLLTIFRGG